MSSAGMGGSGGGLLPRRGEFNGCGNRRYAVVVVFVLGHVSRDSPDAGSGKAIIYQFAR